MPISEPYRRFPDGLPDALLALDELPLLRELGRPTWIRFPGDSDAAPRAIATLLHGDESTGIQALLRILRRQRRFPYDLHVVIGNVAAALAPHGFAHRYLDGQEDMNRVWGRDEPSTTQRLAADGILGELEAAGLESLVDVHNNTGDNPFYAIVPYDDPATLNLATLFTTTLLRWDLRNGTLMEAVGERVAAIAVECGLPGMPASLQFAIDALRRYLGEPPLPTGRVVRDYRLLDGMRRVTVRPGVRFRFGGRLDDDIDLVLPPDADGHNFTEVAAGHVVGAVHPGASMPLLCADREGRDVTADHLAVEDGRVVLSRPATPVMMTRTVEAVRKDCLFYLTDDATPPPASHAATSMPANRSRSSGSTGTSERSTM